MMVTGCHNFPPFPGLKRLVDAFLAVHITSHLNMEMEIAIIITLFKAGVTVLEAHPRATQIDVYKIPRGIVA